MKVMTIVGTRPELIKMSAIIKKLDQHTEHIFVHTGQNYDYELNEIFYEDLGLRKPNYFLGIKGDDLGSQLGTLFTQIHTIIERNKPDAVVILGDTNSALAGIIVKRMKIPLFHLEAGNRCFDDNVPEEINRRILDHIADVNMVYSENERLYLRDEGVAKERTFIMGSPMKEIIKSNMAWQDSDVLTRLELKDKEYFLVSIHRDENTEIKENLDILIDTLKAIGDKYQLPIIVSGHPRFVKKLESKDLGHGITILKPLGFFDYLCLQTKAKCVLSDSGTISEESSILKFPAITIRNAIERPEAVDVGSILMTGVNKENILTCLDIVKAPTTIPKDYDIDNCSDRVLKVILGYTPYVNKYVWGKR